MLETSTPVQDALEKFVNHKRHSQLSQNIKGGDFSFTLSIGDRSRKYGGMLKRLKSTFYPHYKSPKMRRNENSSKSLGERIHRQIAHRVNCIADGVCSCDKKTKKNVMNKHAKAILLKLKNMGITLRRAEIPLLCSAAGFGTRIDLCGIRNKGQALMERSILISIKTGHKKHFNRKPTRSDPYMNPPFNSEDVSKRKSFPALGWYDHPLNHHRLQLLMEFCICSKEYDMTFDECLIIYGAKKDDGPHIEWLQNPRQYLNMYSDILTCLIK